MYFLSHNLLLSKGKLAIKKQRIDYEKKLEALNNLTTELGTQVVLRWVKGHAGFFGNVAADDAAAEAGGIVGAENGRHTRSGIHHALQTHTARSSREVAGENQIRVEGNAGFLQALPIPCVSQCGGIGRKNYD